MERISKFLLIGSILCISGCRKPVVLDTGWTAAQAISQSRDSLISDFSLHKWNNSLLALSSDSGVLVVYLLREQGKSWKRIESDPVQCLPVSIDPTQNRWLAAQARLFKENMEVSFEAGSASDVSGFLTESKTVWRADKSVIFGKTGNEISFGGSPDKPLLQPFWGAAFDGSEICIPYCIRGETVRNRAIQYAEGPFDNGVFWSSDAGLSWSREHISTSSAASSWVCKTTGFYYFFAGEPETHQLSSSRKEGQTWRQQSLVTKHFATGTSAVAEGHTIHVCWLDRRNEKKRSDAVYPWRKNYQVAYCHRKDSDTDWGDTILVSKGLLYAYRPTLSAEGNNVVIVWSGVQTAQDWHDENGPNDIYYVTSNNGGNTWSEPLRVTDNMESGLTAGCPQVALQNGIIHLFYIQGKINYKETSAGMVKLNQPPWPIYYAQRPFPN